MDTSDILYGSNYSSALKQAVLELIETHRISYPIPVLTPTETNDDINGSQHVSNGGTDFTYRDATEEDVEDASSLGHYEYFAEYYGKYTGHYYHGDRTKFAAIVVDPPAYAAELTI